MSTLQHCKVFTLMEHVQPQPARLWRIRVAVTKRPGLQADVAVLEEPEHLNWYHHGRRWTDKFRHVVGVIHTNYLDYALREEDGEAKAKALAIMNQLVCRMHCHKVRPC